MLMLQGNHPPDLQQHPVARRRFPFHFTVENAAFHIEPALVAVYRTTVQMEGMALNTQLNDPGIGHIQHRLVAAWIPVSPFGIHNRLRIKETIQIVPRNRSSGMAVVTFLEIAAHADISIAQCEHALAPLVVLLLIDILVNTPVPVWIQRRRMLIGLHFHR
ncbi:hypothetical protein D3C73_922490 [compost metagenome]